MKNLKSIIMIAVAAAILIMSGCTKEGVQGPAGTAGTNGTNGTNGNANVKVFLFQNGTIGNGVDFMKSLHISSSIVDSSLVLAYYTPGNGFWYESPGLGAGGLYETRMYITAQSTADSVLYFMAIENPDGSAYTGTTVPLTTVKVIVVPGSSFYKTAPVDYSNYKATMKYLGLPE